MTFWGPYTQTIILCPDYSTKFLTMVAIMLQQPIKRCSLIAYQIFWQIFECYVQHKIGQSAQQELIHKAHQILRCTINFLRKLKDFNCALQSEKCGTDSWRPATAACESAFDYNLLTLVNGCKSRSPLDRWTHVFPVVWNIHCNLGNTTEEDMEMAARGNWQTNHEINETCTHAWPPKSNPNSVIFVISIVVVKLNQSCGLSFISVMTSSRKLINAIHLPSLF